MDDFAADKRSRSVFRWTRWAVLLSVLAISTVLGILHQRAPELRILGVDALCPFGGVESFWQVISSGNYIKRTAFGSFALLGAAVGANLLLGRAFCGQFCPLGTIQELFGSLRSKLGIKRREVPRAVDAPARLLKYAVLAIFTLLTWRTANLVIRPYDPWAAYHHLTSAELFTEFGIGAAILGVSVAGSFVYDRFFCKYLCPMGAFLGLFNRASVVAVTRHEDSCIDCGACDTACPVNIGVSTVERVVSDSECISCGLCVGACPKPTSALRFETRVGRAVTPLAVALATLAIMVSVVGVSVASGAMKFANPSLAKQVEQAGYGTGGGAGQGGGQAPLPQGQPGAFDVSLIRGYMTMREVSEATGISEADFITAFGITEPELDVPLKEMKDSRPFDTQAVRIFVAERMGVQSTVPESCE